MSIIRKRLEASRIFRGKFKEARTSGMDVQESIDHALEFTREKYAADPDWEKILTMLMEIIKILLVFL